MSDPIYTVSDYLRAQDILRHLAENLAIQFRVEGETFDRETMQKHMNKRSALITSQHLLVDEAERIAKSNPP